MNRELQNMSEESLQNLEEIVETELHDGDRIELGDVVMTFRSQH